MLTKPQKRTLVSLVRQNQHVLFAKFGPDVTRKRKEAAWEHIRQRLISMGAHLPDVRNVRDFEWGNLKRAAAKRFAENKMTELDKLVMDIVNGTSTPGESPGDPVNIEVTPTIFQGMEDGLTGANGDVDPSTPATSKFSRDFHFSDHANGDETYQEDEFSLNPDGYDVQDPELAQLQKEKVALQKELVRLEMNNMKERSRREREKFRLESEKLRSEIEREKTLSEIAKLQLIQFELQAKELKARTEYYECAKKCLLGQENGNNTIEIVKNEPHLLHEPSDIGS